MSARLTYALSGAIQCGKNRLFSSILLWFANGTQIDEVVS